MLFCPLFNVPQVRKHFPRVFSIVPVMRTVSYISMCSNHWFIHLSMYLFFQLESTVNLFLTKVASGYCKVFPRTPEHLRQSDNSSTWPSNNAGNTWKTFSFSEPGFDLKGGEKGKNCPVKQFSLCRVVHEDKCWYFALRLRFVTSACNTAVEACFWECVERCLLKFFLFLENLGLCRFRMALFGN